MKALTESSKPDHVRSPKGMPPLFPEGLGFSDTPSVLYNGDCGLTCVGPAFAKTEADLVHYHVGDDLASVPVIPFLDGECPQRAIETHAIKDMNVFEAKAQLTNPVGRTVHHVAGLLGHPQL